MGSSKKYYMMIVFVILCSTCAVAQSDYYYYRGKKIPLTLNENKVCVNIPKEKRGLSERIRSNVKVLNTIKDKSFDIVIISRSDFIKLTSLDSWKEDTKSLIISSSYSTERNEEAFTTPYMNVRLKQEEDVDLLIKYAEQNKLRIVRNIPSMPLWYILSLTLDSEKSSTECANELWESGCFAASGPDFSSDDVACSNDPLFVEQWGLDNLYTNYSEIDISAPSAWNHATGKYVKIAIVDNGVDTSHIDLSANIDSLSYNTETGSSPSQVYGWHGTHCAGIAGAVKDNGIHIAGVAPDATIVPVSVNFENNTNLEAKFADGITWAYQHGADIISNSWHLSSLHGDLIDEAIFNAFRYGRQGKGCVIVFAAGNHDDLVNIDTNVLYPANCNDTILVVGAIKMDGGRASFSNYGAALDLVAPGVSILSTVPNDTTETKNGTSMACPHVAGVAALILELNPELTVTEVNSIICSQAKKISGISFNVTKPDGAWSNEYGYGLVDAFGSVLNTPKIEYIQNDTITGEHYIQAEKIYVGRDVTDRKEYGNVVLGPSDDLTLNAKRVIIKNSTKVPIGTTLYVGYEDINVE